MLDGIGMTLELMEEKVKLGPQDACLVTIISDGEENFSKRFTHESIGRIIRRLQATGQWTFTYLGANQNLAHVHKTYGIPMGNMKQWVNDHRGTVMAMAANVNATNAYSTIRSAGLCSTASFYTP